MQLLIILSAHNKGTEGSLEWNAVYNRSNQSVTPRTHQNSLPGLCCGFEDSGDRIASKDVFRAIFSFCCRSISIHRQMRSPYGWSGARRSIPMTHRLCLLYRWDSFKLCGHHKPVNKVSTTWRSRGFFSGPISSSRRLSPRRTGCPAGRRRPLFLKFLGE